MMRITKLSQLLLIVVLISSTNLAFAQTSKDNFIQGLLRTNKGQNAEAMPFFVTVTLVFINPIYFAFIFSAMRVRACLLAMLVGAITGPPLYLLSPVWSLPLCGVLAGTVGFYADRWLRRIR